MSTKVIGDYTAAATIDASTHYLLIQPGSASTAYKKINRNTLLEITGTPVGTTDSQVLTNKTIGNTNTVTLKDTLFTLQDDGDTSKQAKFQLSGITTATTRTYTLPNASSTLADIATSQTFTNKTLTSPTITGGTIDNTTITVDSISGHTSPTIVTVGGVQMNNGTIGTSSAVTTASIADAAVTPAKLIAGTGSGWTWQTWSPTWTNLTIGNGTVNYANYIQTGKTVVFRLRVTFGNTTTIGGTPVSFTLPVALNAATTTNVDTIGYTVQLYDTNVTNYVGGLRVFSSTAVSISAMPVGAYVNLSDMSATVPFAWNSGDIFTVTAYYEAA